MAKAKQLGEAKRMTQRRMRASNGPCIYCDEPASTIEHMPPRSMFRLRDRPKGLEFLACSACQKATRLNDTVAAFAARLWPTVHSVEIADEFRKILPQVRRRVPGLLEEMDMPRASQKLTSRRVGLSLGEAGLLNSGGPIFLKHMLQFSARLGFSIFAEETSEAVPLSGCVIADFYPNAHHLISGALPTEILDLLPAPLTLKQGSKTVRDQFGYSFRQTECRSAFYCFSSFNRSFSCEAIIYIDRTAAPIGQNPKPKTAFVRGVSHPDFATIRTYG